jgi:hypothetical protein
MMEKIKAAMLPLFCGLVLGWILTVTVFGYVTSGTADEMATEAVESMVVEILTPICVANATADPDGLAALMERSSFQRRSAMAATGWVQYPESAGSRLRRAIDQACLNDLPT